MIKLNRNEKVLAVVPEYCSGPGWANRLVTVHIGNYATNEFRSVYLQPDEQRADMHTLFDIGATVHNALRCAINTKESE